VAQETAADSKILKSPYMLQYKLAAYNHKPL